MPSATSNHQQPVARPTQRRRGTVLIYLVILLPIIFGVLAILLDRGAGAYTQRTMQSAADTAAVEGLLHKDTLLTDAQKRERVRTSIRQYYDDDLNPGNGDEGNFAAGGIANVTTPGRTNLNGSETIDYANPMFYDPDPQLNLANLAHGDMVLGHFLQDARHDEGYNVNPYDRDDFVPDGNPVPADSTQAFMVRLRRTANYATAAHQDNQPGVSSAGPPVPALFARGSMAKAQAPGEASIRRDGLTVRATSIASAEKTTRLGPLIPPELTGAGTLFGWNIVALTADEYATLDVGVPRNYVMLADGTIVRAGTPDPVGKQIRITTLANSDQPFVPGALSANATTITVSSSLGFGPDAVSLPFLIRIDQEVMQVTARNGDDWTVIRGFQGTTPASHDSDALIYLHEAARLGDIMETAQRLLLPEAMESATGVELLVRVSGTETHPSATYDTFYTIEYLASTDGLNTAVDRIQFSLAPGINFRFAGGNGPVVGPGSVDTNGVPLTNANVLFSQTSGNPNGQNVRFAPGIYFGPGAILNFGMGTEDAIDNGEEWDTVGDGGTEIQVLAFVENGETPQPRNVYEFASQGAGSATSIGVQVNSPRSRNVAVFALIEEAGRLYMPIYDPAINDRLVGFGVADVVPTDLGIDDFALTITKNASQVAPNNASATFGGDFNQQGLPMNNAEIDLIFDARRDFNAEPVHSPASVRASSK